MADRSERAQFHLEQARAEILPRLAPHCGHLSPEALAELVDKVARVRLHYDPPPGLTGADFPTSPYGYPVIPPPPSEGTP